MKLVLATKNAGKVREMRAILAGKFDEIVTAEEMGVKDEVEETGQTFLDNARIKARAIARLTGCAALADDSGLCVDALNGAPGVYSARFAGEHGNDRKNNEKLLALLEGKDQRSAHYACSMALCLPDGKEIVAVGEWHGEIAKTPAGDNGFGYDPYFYLPDLECTAAELSAEEKNRISHRARAITALLEQL